MHSYIHTYIQVTLNIALSEDYEGGALVFYGARGTGEEYTALTRLQGRGVCDTSVTECMYPSLARFGFKAEGYGQCRGVGPAVLHTPQNQADTPPAVTASTSGKCRPTCSTPRVHAKARLECMLKYA